ncbi:MAG: MFS transporter, partial [Oscillospiraceae bacterium]|nr:MFS transporter [Oscillospiraceae bacterium]
TLADLLGCTLDYIMMEPLTEDGQVDALAVKREQTEMDQVAYDAYHAMVGVLAKKIAGGVTLVLGGIAATTLTAAWCLPEREWVCVATFFLFLMAAVFLFVTGGMEEDDFKKNNPEILPLFDPMEELAFQKTFRTVVASCVVGILGDIAICAVLATTIAATGTGVGEIYIGALFMALLTLCVVPIVYMGCLSDRYDPKEMSEHKRKNDLAGPIMILATACFLIWGLMWDGWKVSWVCFLIGAALVALTNSVQKKD